MTDEVENLVLEHLRAIRADIAKLNEKVDTLQVEMTAMRQVMMAVVTLQNHDHAELAVVKSRLERIERRLDLVE